MPVTSDMYYICTVHFKNEIWIEKQIRYLQHNVKCDYKVFACVPGTRTNKSFYLESSYSPQEASGDFNHACKLNYLAQLVSAEAKRDDTLIFLDGDAFPIRPINSYVDSMLDSHKLIAVQRLENNGDIQPHPSFTATKVGFWQDIGGDWLPGHKWTNSNGISRTDAGGNLLRILDDNGIDWLKMHRTNKNNFHPVFFGIYEDVIYHHGAGFRRPISWFDLIANDQNYIQYRTSDEYKKNTRLQKDVYNMIETDPEFWKSFI